MTRVFSTLLIVSLFLTAFSACAGGGETANADKAASTSAASEEAESLATSEAGESPSSAESASPTAKAHAPEAATEMPSEAAKTAADASQAAKQVSQAPFDHSAWDQLMKTHVKDGVVNYKGIKGEMALFNTYLKSLETNPPPASANRDEVMAFWINAYNAFTVKLMLDNYPLKSIMDLDGGKVWERKWIKIGGETMSLNHIEHDILRKKYFDPRIHFGVVCASFSCPALRSEAYNADRLDAQLTDQAKKFVNDPRRNTLSATAPKISSLFDWYKDDFTKKGSVIEYINQYANTKINANATLGYMDYKWSLNE